MIPISLFDDLSPLVTVGGDNFQISGGCWKNTKVPITGDEIEMFNEQFTEDGSLVLLEHWVHDNMNKTLHESEWHSDDD